MLISRSWEDPRTRVRSRTLWLRRLSELSPRSRRDPFLQSLSPASGVKFLGPAKGSGGFRTTYPQPDWQAYAAIRTYHPKLASKALKCYWRAPATPKALADALKPYTVPLKNRNLPRNAHFIRAKSLVKEMFLLPSKVSALYTDKMQDLRVHLTKSAGISYPGLNKGQAFTDAIQQARMLAHFAKTNDAWRVTRQTPPCKIAARLHLTVRAKKKVRPVWVYPFEMTFIELLFAQPLLSAFGKKNGEYPTPYMKGIDIVGELPHVLNRMQRDDCDWVGKDVSKFDASVHPSLIKWAFNEVLGQNICFGTSPYYQRRKRKLYEYVQDYFIKTPFVTAHGNLFKKSHGVPSGSAFTGLIGSVVSTLYTVYDFLRQDCETLQRPLAVGDDTLDLIRSSSTWSSAKARLHYRELCAQLSVEDSKRGSLRDVPFLGHFHSGSVVRRDEVECAARLIWPERQLSITWLTFIRAVMLDVDSGLRFWWLREATQLLSIQAGVFQYSHHMPELDSIRSWWFALTGQSLIKVPCLDLWDRYLLVHSGGGGL